MRKRKLQWTALSLALLLMFTLTACGGSSASSRDSYAAANGVASESAVAYDGDYGYYDDVEEPAMMDEATFESASTAGSGVSSDAKQAQQASERKDVKIIYTANLNVEALDLDAAVDALNQLVDEMGGYFQSSDRGSYGRSRNASFTVRVPSSKYRAFVDAWSDSENCKLISVHEDTEDVGVRYFDLETHLTTLRNKMNRLQALLEQATEMEDIIQLESAISDTEYQIEMYTSDLNRYDSLINYSTVNLTISEVVQLEEEEEITFLQRLGQNLRWGLRDFGEALEDLIVWIAYNLLNIIITIVIIVVIVRLLRRRKRTKAINGAGGKSFRWKERRQKNLTEQTSSEPASSQREDKGE